MSKHPTNNKVGYEPVPGYILRKRLGAGGYGEVWLADAPGGLQKAVKLIYGTVDESHASSELRSLQRIRQVYHPFLLSIERIEIVSNQVVIVTELAESSLLDRYEQFRRKGAPGIPRSALLDFMRDAADALDFLAQKHALQHLDVKPGNLLIIADRIKVADFGLIKDLHDQNQSLVSGLTPTYSAPEIFDGRPDYRSDQYSLAIVYMEMLTGQLPFGGRTTGELARQHINQAPSLDALPPADRPIVARALSKNPLDRYSTCRNFVEQLLKTRSTVLPVSLQKDLLYKDEAAEGESGSGESGTGESGTVETQSASTQETRSSFSEAINIDLLASDWLNARSMFIGVGGVGLKALVELRNVANDDCDSRFGVNDLAWLGIDTDGKTLSKLTEDTEHAVLPPSCAIQLPIYKPTEYRDAPSELFVPISRRWLYNIPRSLATEGVRPLAVLAFLDHYVQLKKKLSGELRELIAKQHKDDEPQQPLRIYVLASLHGGTGSGLAAEIGSLVRRILSELRFSNYRLSAGLTAATTVGSQEASLSAAAAISALSELTYLMNREHEVPSIFYGDTHSAPSCVQPFDWVTLVDGGLLGNQAELQSAVRTLANTVWLDGQTMVGAVMSETRARAVEQTHGWLRAVETKAIETSTNISAQNLARWCCEQTLTHALRYMVGPRGVATSTTRLFNSSQKLDSGTPTVSGDLPLTDYACQEFIKRLLGELGMRASISEAAAESPSLTETLLHQWSRRLSNDTTLINQQLGADINIWKQSISKITQMRVYNWKQIEQIQLNVIEGILDYSEREAPGFIGSLAPYRRRLGASDKLTEQAVTYLRRFSEECVKLFNRLQSDGKTMGSRIRSWCESIQAEKALNEASWEVNIVCLPPRLQLLASRVSAVLESTIHRLALQILDDSEKSLGLPSAVRRSTEQIDNVNLPYVLSLANDLTNRISSELGITAAEFSGASENNEGVSYKRLESFCPSLAVAGGQIQRLVIAPYEQTSLVAKNLSKRNLTATTTLVPATRSLGSHVMCEAGGLSLQHMVASLWRPTPQTLLLAERLRTRIDIEWEAATALLESTENASPLVLVTSVVGAEGSFPPPGVSPADANGR